MKGLVQKGFETIDVVSADFFKPLSGQPRQNNYLSRPFHESSDYPGKTRLEVSDIAIAESLIDVVCGNTLVKPADIRTLIVDTRPAMPGDSKCEGKWHSDGSVVVYSVMDTLPIQSLLGVLPDELTTLNRPNYGPKWNLECNLRFIADDELEELGLHIETAPELSVIKTTSPDIHRSTRNESNQVIRRNFLALVLDAEKYEMW